MADFLDYTGLKYYDKKLKEYFDKEIESQIDSIEDISTEEIDEIITGNYNPEEENTEE